MRDDNRIVQGFWHGAPLTTMERLSMQSFVHWGHEFHLYVYDGNMKGVPNNVHLHNAAEIMPESKIDTFRCAQQMSDYFRIALLYKCGGWYSDLDNVLLKYLDFESEFVFYRDHDESTISFALSKAPAGSALFKHCYDFLRNMPSEDRAHLDWQEIGSDFACGAVEYHQMTGFAKSGRTFDPVHWENVRTVVDPTVKWDLNDSYSVHLFHAAWNAGPKDKTGRGFDLGQRPGVPLDTDREYSPECLYEQLKERYLRKLEVKNAGV